jgi:hypothetical protein
MLDTHPAHCFAASYAEARSAFLTACAQSGAEIVSHRHPLAGPDGAALFLDDARVGRADARCVLFVASGTHGIEGFCGSGIQTFLLRGGIAARLPDDVALVFVHAVNPWGFAWLRRVNEDNVDVNRNFLNHTAPHPVNADYDGLYDALNPVRSTLLLSPSRSRRCAASKGAVGRRYTARFRAGSMCIRAASSTAAPAGVDEPYPQRYGAHTRHAEISLRRPPLEQPACRRHAAADRSQVSVAARLARTAGPTSSALSRHRVPTRRWSAASSSRHSSPPSRGRPGSSSSSARSTRRR